MKFTIKWSYPSTVGGNAAFEQTYILSIGARYRTVRTPSFCAGVYISNLINACGVERDLVEDEGSEVRSAWREILGERYADHPTFEGKEKYMLYDAMAFPAFCIYKNVKTLLKDVGNSIAKRNVEECSPITKSLLGEKTIEEFSKAEWRNREIQRFIQSRIDAYVSDYNELLTSAGNDRGIEFYQSLRKSLDKYNDGNHELIAQYLSEENRRSRCFATFIKSEDNEKYVSFSGSVDVKDEKILNWLGKSAPEAFVEVAEDICRTLNATFVPLNLDTRKYVISKYYPIDVRQDFSVDDLINMQMDGRDVIGEYSCCERKIFGYFIDDTPNGTLYVKMQICARCALGLAYQWLNGSKIELHDGLGV